MCAAVLTNGLDFAPTAFQNLLYQAAGDEELLLFAGKPRSIESIVLLCNGISFAIQVVVFLVIGSFADFGTWRPNILIGLSIIAYGIGFGWLGVHDPEKWHVAIGLYMVGLIAYQTTLTFWTAAFPGLARNTPEMKAKADEYQSGSISREEYDFADTMKRSQLANIAFYIQSVAEVFILAIIVGIMFGLRVDDSEQNNNWGLSVLIAFATGVWLLVSLPWFFLEKRRPGQDTMGQSIVVAGFQQLYLAVQQIWKLKQSLLYLVGELGAVPCHCLQPVLIRGHNRVLPPRRLSQHNCHCDCNLAKQYSSLQHTPANLPVNSGYRSAGELTRHQTPFPPTINVLNQ